MTRRVLVVLIVLLGSAVPSAMAWSASSAEATEDVGWLCATPVDTSSPEMAKLEAEMAAEWTRRAERLTDPGERAAAESGTFFYMSKGYRYSPKTGLLRSRNFRPDADGMVTLPDGSKMPVPRESERGALSLTYEPYRRVTSDTGYRKAEGTVSLPSSEAIDGLQAGDAAYNYFGHQRLSSITEAGVFSKGGLGGQWAVGQWFVFWNFNGYYNMDMWQYGIDPGSDVLMRR